MVATLLIPVVTALLLAAPAPPADPQTAFDQALKLFESFQDEKAAVALRALLATSPPGRIAAKAHLYLGVIAFNAIQPEAAQHEFRLALENNPSVELSGEVSPKVNMAFAEARHAVMRELETDTSGATAAPPLPPSAPPPIQPPASPPTVVAQPAEAQPEASRSHALSLALGGAGVVAAAFAVVGGAEVASFNSAVSQLSPGGKTEAYAVATGQRSTAQTWQAVGILCAVAAAAGLTGAVLT